MQDEKIELTLQQWREEWLSPQLNEDLKEIEIGESQQIFTDDRSLDNEAEEELVKKRAITIRDIPIFVLRISKTRCQIEFNWPWVAAGVGGIITML